jgi:hypothetical protein
VHPVARTDHLRGSRSHSQGHNGASSPASDDRTRCRVPVTAKNTQIGESQIEMQMAVPTFVKNFIMHRAAMAHTECEWKRGKGSAQRLTSRTGSKPTATAVLTNGLLMEAHFEDLGDAEIGKKRRC